MFERFTDRSRKILALATQEAIKRGTRFVETEHLLLGMIGEGSGVAANVLKNCGISTNRVNKFVDEIVPPLPKEYFCEDKNPSYSPQLKKLFEEATKQAVKLNHNYVGTEHLLLALLQETTGLAREYLDQYYEIRAIRDDVLNLLGHLEPPKLKLNTLTVKYITAKNKDGKDELIGYYHPHLQSFAFITEVKLDELEQLVKNIRNHVYD